MSAVDKKGIRIQIRDLEESNCIGCKKLTKWRRDVGNHQAYNKCLTVCPVGKKLRRLGDLLTYGRPTRVARDITEERYLELRDEEGKNDLQICEEYGISESQLRRRKDHWGIKLNQTKWTSLSLEQYLKYREDGISDDLICSLLGWDRKTIIKFKKKHGLIGQTPIHHVKYTAAGKEITPDLYLEDLRIYKSDAATARAWGVHISTFERIKRKWRESGQI